MSEFIKLNRKADASSIPQAPAVVSYARVSSNDNSLNVVDGSNGETNSVCGTALLCTGNKLTIMRKDFVFDLVNTTITKAYLVGGSLLTKLYALLKLDKFFTGATDV